ncbi:MAG: hypothetical protein ACLRS8_18285 [Parabacteroides merdae]
MVRLTELRSMALVYVKLWLPLKNAVFTGAAIAVTGFCIARNAGFRKRQDLAEIDPWAGCESLTNIRGL